MSMVRAHVHGECPFPCPQQFFMCSTCLWFMPIVPAEGPCPCCMSMSISMLHVRVHAECPFPCCMPMLHVNLHIHYASPLSFCMSMSILDVQHVFVIHGGNCPCCMSMSILPVHGHSAFPCPEVDKSDDIKSVNNIFGSPVSAWKEVGRVGCCMNMSILRVNVQLHVHVHVNAGCPFPCPCSRLAARPYPCCTSIVHAVCPFPTVTRTSVFFINIYCRVITCVATS
jgi:hypothetical protein